jgi:hypothetical protein
MKYPKPVIERPSELPDDWTWHLSRIPGHTWRAESPDLKVRVLRRDDEHYRVLVYPQPGTRGELELPPGPLTPILVAAELLRCAVRTGAGLVTTNMRATAPAPQAENQPAPASTPRVHDYRKRRGNWAHSCFFVAAGEAGTTGMVHGFGLGVRVGDILALGDGTPYRVLTAAYEIDPADQWSASVERAPDDYELPEGWAFDAVTTEPSPPTTEDTP